MSLLCMLLFCLDVVWFHSSPVAIDTNLFHFFVFSRECQLRSDCGSWSGLSGQHGPRQRSVRWSRKSVLLSARLLERKTIRTVAEMWQSYSICTCWATQRTLGRYVCLVVMVGWEWDDLFQKSFLDLLQKCSSGCCGDCVALFSSWSVWSWLRPRSSLING